MRRNAFIPPYYVHSREFHRAPHGGRARLGRILQTIPAVERRPVCIAAFKAFQESSGRSIPSTAEAFSYRARDRRKAKSATGREAKKREEEEEDGQVRRGRVGEAGRIENEGKANNGVFPFRVHVGGNNRSLGVHR